MVVLCPDVCYDDVLPVNQQSDKHVELAARHYASYQRPTTQLFAAYPNIHQKQVYSNRIMEGKTSEEFLLSSS